MSGTFRGTDRYVATSAYDALILSDNPVAYWRVDGTGTDVTGHGHDATVHGTPTASTFLTGEPCVTFDGGGTQYLEIPDHDALSVPTTGVLTFEAWIRPDTLNFSISEGTGPYVWWAGKLGTHNSTTVAEWACRMYNNTNTVNRPNRISAYAFNPTGGLGSGSFFQDTVTTGQWIHYIMVINMANTSAFYPTGYTQIFKDGLQRGQDPLNQFNTVPQNCTAPMRIASATLDSFFQGGIAKVAVYDYELTQAQALAHYTQVVPHTATARFITHIGHASTTTSGTKLNLTVGSEVPVSAGSTLIVKVAHAYTSSAPTMADSKGNVYTRDRTSADGALTYRHSVFSAQINAALYPGDVIQLVTASAVADKVMSVDQYSGVTFSSPLDVIQGTGGSSVSPGMSTPTSTTHDDDLIIGMCTVSGPVTDTYSEDAGYTARTRVSVDDGSLSLVVNSADRAVTTTGAYNYRPVLGTSRSWLLNLASYKGGLPTVTPPTLGTGAYIDRNGSASSQSSSTTLVITVGQDGIAADHLASVLVVSDWTTAVPTCTDSRSNTYTADRSGQDTGHTVRGTIFSARTTTALQVGDTVTITWSTAIVNKAAVLDEYSGVLLPITVDVNNGAAGTSVSPSVSATTTNANDLLISLVGVLGPTADTFSPDVIHQWTIPDRYGTNSGSGDVTVNAGWRAVGATGTYSMAPDLGTSRTWIALVAAYKGT